MAPKAKQVGSMEVVEYAPGEAPPVPPKAKQVIDFVCGLRKVGPRAYEVVSGRIVDGVPEIKAHGGAQPLEHAADELRLTFHKTMRDIP